MIYVAYPRIEKHLRDIRMTKAELALRIGTSRETVSRIMTGKSMPRLDVCMAICRETGCRLSDWEATHES